MNDLEPIVIDYDELAHLGFAKVTIHYNGGGDEGHIEDVYIEPLTEGEEGAPIEYALNAKLEQLAVDLLHEHFGGWELNSGSSGDIVIDTVQRKTFLKHGWIVERTEYENKEV